MGFLSEEFIDKGSYVQYKYNVSGEGERFLETAQPAPEQLIDIIEKMQVQTSRFLELVSTLLYFDHLAKKEQIEKVHIVKNKLKFSDLEMDTAFDFIQQLEHQIAK